MTLFHHWTKYDENIKKYVIFYAIMNKELEIYKNICDIIEEQKDEDILENYLNNYVLLKKYSKVNLENMVYMRFGHQLKNNLLKTILEEMY